MSSNHEGDIPDEVDLEGPDDGGWYHTKVLDWITLNTDINHPAFRLYAVMRSLCIEKRAPVRRLKIEELRKLVPGVNGKECSRTAVEDAIARLKRNGLIKALDTGASGGAVRWRVNDLPPDPESYEGWRNTFDKLDAIREEVEKTEDPQFNNGVPGKPGSSGRGTRKTGQGTRKTGQGTRKTGQGTRKTGSFTGDDQPKHDHQEPPQDVLEEELEPTPRTSADDTSGTEPTSVGHEGGREESSKDKQDEAHEFFASVPASSAAWKTVKPHMLKALFAAYWAALDDGHTPSFLRGWLSENLPTNIQSLAGLWLSRMENLPEPTSAVAQTPAGAGPQPGTDYPTEPCGECDGRPGESWNTRVVYDNGPNASPKPKPCSECHPYGCTNRPALRVVS